MGAFAQRPTVLVTLSLVTALSASRPVGSAGAASPVLYRSNVGCGACFMEMVLAGHPTDPDQLALIGLSGGLQLSADGGRRWTAGTLSGADFTADAKLLVTPDGTLLLSALIARPHPLGTGSVYAGGLFRGPLSGATFGATIFKDPPTTLPAGEHVAVDFPKLAYDRSAGTIYISGNAVHFEDGTIGMGLFVSHDGGAMFAAERLDYQPAGSTRVSPPLSMDTTPTGALRAVFTATVADRDRQYLLRFNADASSFTVMPGLAIPDLSVGVARVAAGSATWLVYQGPEMAIDRTPGGPHEGRVYLAWAQPASVVVDATSEFGRYGLDFDVRLAFSDDDGETWSEPVLVNDDATTGDQIFPSLRLDADGGVHVAFLDRRRSPEQPTFDVFYALVEDGRVSPNVQVNDAPVANAAGGRAVSDYLDMVAAYPSRVYVAYPCGGVNDGPMDACITALDPALVRSPVTTTTVPPSSTTTTTSSTTSSSLTPTTIITARSCLPLTSVVCDDGDACTDDAGDAVNGCFSSGRSPTTPSGVLCVVDNLRAMIDLPPQPVCGRSCPRSLAKRLDAVRRSIDAAGRARARRACAHRRRVALRVARQLATRVARLAAAGRFVSPERAGCMQAEARRLRDNATTLAHAPCAGGLAATSKEPGAHGE